VNEGDKKSPSSFLKMTQENQLQAIEAMIHRLLEDSTVYFAVEVKIKPTNNIKVFIDGDQGVPIEKYVTWNRALYRQIEEAGLYPDGDFSLEVSSPGLDEPLKLLRQYQKNIGRAVEVIMRDGRKIEGKMTAAGETGITVETVTGKGKKAETQVQELLFDNIKTTKIQVVF
jgi:ribosome maturation factor RimP